MAGLAVDHVPVENTDRIPTPKRRLARGLVVLAVTGSSLTLGSAAHAQQQGVDAAQASVPAPTARLIEPDIASSDDTFIVPIAIGAAVMAWAGVLRARRRTA